MLPHTPSVFFCVNQVLIEVSACGVNPSDTYIRAGTYRNLPSLPYTPGKDCAGVVLATGGDVSDFRVCAMMCGVDNIVCVCL